MTAGDDERAAERAREAFGRVFRTGPEGVWAAPGRVNVIGEHTDYNGGFVLPVALPLTTRAAVGRRADGRLGVASVQHPGEVVEVDLAGLRPGVPPGWGAYPAGVVAQLAGPVASAGGVSILLDGDVPAGAGLSSSAALECAVVVALRDLLGLDLAAADLVDLARRAENEYVGAPTGILDQSASLLCRAGHALFLDTRDRSTEQVPFDLAAASLALLVIDTGTTHDHAAGGYGERRRECERSAAVLGVPLLRDITEVDRLASLANGRDGGVLLRRARHVVTENARVLQVVTVLREGGDPRRIGSLLTAGHASLRDDFEVSTPLLDACVQAALDAGAHGARMVGGGFGGSAIALVDEAAVEPVARAVTDRIVTAGSAPPRTFVVVPSAGARRLA